jgi:hypothetical protein
VSGSAPAPALETRTLDRCLACGGTELTRRALRYEYRETSFPLLQCDTCGMRLGGCRRRLARAPHAEPYFESDFRCGSAV